MLREIVLSISLGMAVLPLAATASETGKSASPAEQSGGATRPGDPMGNLKPYEERRYRIDMQDCDKEKGVDRKVCERTVRNRAVSKSRRRGNAN